MENDLKNGRLPQKWKTTSKMEDDLKSPTQNDPPQCPYLLVFLFQQPPQGPPQRPQIMARQQQIIHQHMASLSEQDRAKFTQMSSVEKHQYLANRNLLITNTTLQMQHTTIGKKKYYMYVANHLLQCSVSLAL